MCQTGADGVGDGAGDESALEAGRRGFAAAYGECVDEGRGVGQCRVEACAGGLDGGGVEVCGVGCEHGSPCVGEGFGCRDERDDAVGVVGVHGSSSRCGCATPIDLLYNLQGDLYNISTGVSVGFSLENGRKAADRELIRASVATLVFPTESPLNWVCARWPEGSLFGHWRFCVAFVQVSCRSTRRGVREHPAPSGALRR